MFPPNNQLLNISIIAPSLLPVPAVKGGAIESLITGFIDKNEEQKGIRITVFSHYKKVAAKLASKYYY